MACRHNSDEQDSATSSSQWDGQVELCSALRAAEPPKLHVREWLMQPAFDPAYCAPAAAGWEQDIGAARSLRSWRDVADGGVAVVPHAQPKRRPSLLYIPSNDCSDELAHEPQLVPSISSLRFQKRRKCHEPRASEAQECSGESTAACQDEPPLLPSPGLFSLCALEVPSSMPAHTPHAVPPALAATSRPTPFARPAPLVVPPPPEAPQRTTPRSSGVRRRLAVDVEFGAAEAGDIAAGGALSSANLRASVERWMAAMEEDCARRRVQRELMPSGGSAASVRTVVPPPAFVLLGLAAQRVS